MQIQMGYMSGTNKEFYLLGSRIDGDVKSESYLKEFYDVLFPAPNQFHPREGKRIEVEAALCRLYSNALDRGLKK